MFTNPSILLIGTESNELRLCESVISDSGFTDVQVISQDTLTQPHELTRKDVYIVICSDPVGSIPALRSFRDVLATSPILAIDATGDREFVVRALEAGADDLTRVDKVSVQLAARVRALYRRYNYVGERSIGMPLVVGGLKMDFRLHKVWIDEVEVPLTPIEFRILRALCMHMGKVVPHQELLTEGWGEHRPEMADALRVYIRYLRRKMKAVSPLVTIVSRPGIGYMLSIAT